MVKASGELAQQLDGPRLERIERMLRSPARASV
jgi:hypothetical protein